MNCAQAELYVSALCDGEDVPPYIARHILECQVCHRTLHDYSKMGSELRLATAVQETQLTPLSLPRQTNAFRFLSARVNVPRFALAALVASLVIATITAAIVRAESRPLWFEFAYGLEANPQFDFKVAQRGYDDTAAITRFSNGSLKGAAVRVRIESISANDVMLRVRAVPPRFEVTSTSVKVAADSNHKISLDGVSAIQYKPGALLRIPIEGGGTLYLKGKIVDAQPKIAFGVPLEPLFGELVVRSPVLITEDRLLGELNGATSIAENDNRTIAFRLGANGNFIFALKPFPGAALGEANWGEITFKLDGRNYRLIAAAPITGGDQPRPVWVRRDAASEGASGGAGLGGGPIPK